MTRLDQTKHSTLSGIGDEKLEEFDEKYNLDNLEPRCHEHIA